MQIPRARSTRALKILQESQFEICMHALRIRCCCWCHRCHCCRCSSSSVDSRLGEAISVESMHGWSHARMLMADGGCMHRSYCLLQMWLRICLVTVFLILKRKEAWHGPLDISRGWSELFRWCSACLCNAIFVSEKFGIELYLEVTLTRMDMAWRCADIDVIFM